MGGVLAANRKDRPLRPLPGLTFEIRSLFPGWTGTDLSRRDRFVWHKLYERAYKPTRFSGPIVHYAPHTETPDGFWVSRRHGCLEPLEAAKKWPTGDRASSLGETFQDGTSSGVRVP